MKEKETTLHGIPKIDFKKTVEIPKQDLVLCDGLLTIKKENIISLRRKK